MAVASSIIQPLALQRPNRHPQPPPPNAASPCQRRKAMPTAPNTRCAIRQQPPLLRQPPQGKQDNDTTGLKSPYRSSKTPYFEQHSLYFEQHLLHFYRKTLSFDQQTRYFNQIPLRNVQKTLFFDQNQRYLDQKTRYFEQQSLYFSQKSAYLARNSHLMKAKLPAFS
jgi:hypothetical protein